MAIRDVMSKARCGLRFAGLLVLIPGFAAAAQGTVNYQYDEAGRLRGVEYVGQSQETHYTLDPAGNRTLVTSGAPLPAGTLQFSSATYSVAENGGSVTITVTRTGGSFGAASANYSTVDGTATTVGNDYTATSGTLNWTNGDAASKTFGVSVALDALLEGSETITVNLTGVSGAGAGSPASATITITDTDGTPPGAPGTPTFSSVTGTTATASWAAATDNFGVTGYRYQLNGGGWTEIGNVTSVGLSGLAGYTNYTFNVQARDAAGNWGAGANNSFTTADGTAPSAPGTPSFSSIAATTAAASWGVATDNVGVTGYRYQLNGGGWTEIGNFTSVGLSGLVDYTSYTFNVQARDAAGNWGAGASNSFTTADGTAPSAPGTPSFSSIAITSATASWSAATDNAGVTGYRYRLNGGGWTEISNVTSVGLSGLASYTTYAFEVQARDAVGNWGAGASNSFTTVDGTAPGAPGAPSFSSITATTATANWGAAADNAGVTGYRYRLNGGGWTEISNVTSVGLSGLSSYTNYAFEVQARDAVGNWGPGASNAFTTADGTAPGAPGTPSFSSIAVTTATASWGAATDNLAVTGYRYRLNGGGWSEIGNVTSVGLSGLASYTTYVFEIQARDAAGNWGVSASDSFATADGTAPSAPGTPSFTSITVTTATASWSAATDNAGVTGYRYRINGGSWNEISNVTSIGLSGLTSYTNYAFEVQARDAVSNWGAGASNSFTTVDGTAPGAPGTPTFNSITATTATAIWSAASDNVGVTGYRYRLNSGSWNEIGNVTSFGLTGLSASTGYAFDIQARDAASNWGASSSNSFTTTPPIPGAPTGLNMQLTGCTWTATWNPVANATFYLVGNTADGLVQSVTPTSAQVNCISTINSQPNQPAWVRACNPGGCGSEANFTGVAAPGVPSSISVPTASSTGTFNISWGTASGTVTTYELYEANNASFSGASQVYSGGSTSAALGGRESGTYYYRVRACNSGLCSDYMTGGNALVVTLPPGAPSSISVPSSSSTGSFTISWGTAPGSVTAYELYEAANPSFSGAVLVYNNTGTSVALSGRSSGTYYYQVRACNAGGCSDFTIGGNSLVVNVPSATITIPNLGFNSLAQGGSTATYSLTPTGVIRRTQTNGTTLINDGFWLTPQSGMSGFEVRATLLGGSCSSGPIGTWVNLGGAGVTWTRSVSGSFGATAQCQISLEVRNASTQVIVNTPATIIITAVGS